MKMPYDYTDAPPPRDFELIPHGTIATVTVKVRPGNAGEGGILKRSKDGTCEMLDLELTVVEGEYARRKFWVYLVLAGTTPGQQEVANSSRGTLKQILDSACNLDPNDKSPEARALRNKDLKDFDGLNFIAKIGVEKGKPKNDGSGENWPDKNIIAAIITPDRREWHPVEQSPPFNGRGNGAAVTSSGSASTSPGSTAAPSAPTASVKRPEWANDEP
jgi:hypothetical protein